MSGALINNGVGPAIIQSLTVRFRGKTYTDPAQLVDLLVQQAGRTQSLKLELFYANLSPGDVVKTDERLLLVRQERNPLIADSLLAMIQDSSYHFKVVYQDVYHNQWILTHSQGRSQVSLLSAEVNQH